MSFQRSLNLAIDEWLDSPLFASEVLEALFRDDGNGNFDRYNAHSKVMLASKIHPVTLYYTIGGNMYQYQQNVEPISNELMRSFHEFIALSVVVW